MYKTPQSSRQFIITIITSGRQQSHWAHTFRVKIPILCNFFPDSLEIKALLSVKLSLLWWWDSNCSTWFWCMKVTVLPALTVYYRCNSKNTGLLSVFIPICIHFFPLHIILEAPHSLSIHSPTAASCFWLCPEWDPVRLQWINQFPP